MGFFHELGKGLKGLHRGGKSALRDSFSTLTSLFGNGGKSAVKTAFFRLLVYVFRQDDAFPPRMEKLFCNVMADLAPDINAEQVWGLLENMPSCTEADVLTAFETIPAEKKVQFIRFAAALVYHKDGFRDSAEKLKEIALKTGMTLEEFQSFISAILDTQARRERMIRSGAGIIAALIVILVFILTATLLRSVIFGLIFAYLLLPLEQFFERNWREKRGPGFYLGKTASLLCYLPRKVASVLSRKDKDTLPTPEQLRKKDEQKIIARAVSQTFVSILLAAVLFGGGVYALSSYYLRGFGEKMRPSAEIKNVPPDGKMQKKEFSPANELQKIRTKLETVPALKYLIEKAENSLRDEQTRNEVIAMLWRRSGGVFSFLFNVMGVIGTLVCDLLLTLFFGLLFLMKMAEFKNSGRGGGGNYAVKTILVSNWLPNVSDATLAEAQRILSGVFSRLRIWVRGYLTLVLIDSTVYTILFGILDVPFFPLLGIIAGCGILLPYVGPIFSCGLTLLVTYLAGDAGIAQLVLVLCCYLVYNGIVEQFILYPMVIGESLGLTTLETIIVVLLGAVFAGIAGMILALPAASVIKYLVPQIYRFWDTLIHRKSNSLLESSGE